jgi:hypothetical protein
MADSSTPNGMSRTSWRLDVSTRRACVQSLRNTERCGTAFVRIWRFIHPRDDDSVKTTLQDCRIGLFKYRRATGNTTLLDPDTRDEITINPVERICVCFR